MIGVDPSNERSIIHRKKGATRIGPLDYALRSEPACYPLAATKAQMKALLAYLQGSRRALGKNSCRAISDKVHREPWQSRQRRRFRMCNLQAALHRWGKKSLHPPHEI